MDLQRRAMRKQYQKGFGLLEVVIASMILVTVVGAVVALGSASVNGGVTSADKTTAYNLVQECLEAVRAKRNTAWLEAPVGGALKEWYGNFLSNPTANTVDRSLISRGGKCYSDTTIGTPAVSYKRLIVVKNVDWYSPTATPAPPKGGDGSVIPQDKIRLIEVSVTWNSVSGPKTITGSTYLTDWKAL